MRIILSVVLFLICGHSNGMDYARVELKGRTLASCLVLDPSISCLDQRALSVTEVTLSEQAFAAALTYGKENYQNLKWLTEMILNLRHIPFVVLGSEDSSYGRGLRAEVRKDSLMFYVGNLVVDLVEAGKPLIVKRDAEWAFQEEWFEKPHMVFLYLNYFDEAFL